MINFRALVPQVTARHGTDHTPYRCGRCRNHTTRCRARTEAPELYGPTGRRAGNPSTYARKTARQAHLKVKRCWYFEHREQVRTRCLMVAVAMHGGPWTSHADQAWRPSRHRTGRITRRPRWG